MDAYGVPGFEPAKQGVVDGGQRFRSLSGRQSEELGYNASVSIWGPLTLSTSLAGLLVPGGGADFRYDLSVFFWVGFREGALDCPPFLEGVCLERSDRPFLPPGPAPYGRCNGVGESSGPDSIASQTWLYNSSYIR